MWVSAIKSDRCRKVTVSGGSTVATSFSGKLCSGFICFRLGKYVNSAFGVITRATEHQYVLTFSSLQQSAAHWLQYSSYFSSLLKYVVP